MHRNQTDVDLLVDFEPGATLFEQFYLQEELEALLNVHVDVIPRSGSSHAITVFAKKRSPLR